MNKIDRVVITAYSNGDYRITFTRPSSIHSYWVTGRKVAQESMLMNALAAKTVTSVHPFFSKYFISITYQMPNLPPQEEAGEALAKVCVWLMTGALGNPVDVEA
jgi:hypothetical protein